VEGGNRKKSGFEEEQAVGVMTIEMGSRGDARREGSRKVERALNRGGFYIRETIRRKGGNKTCLGMKTLQESRQINLMEGN